MQTSLSLKDISKKYNAIIRGWSNYIGRFYKNEMENVFRHINSALQRLGAKEVQTSREAVEPMRG
ncbi:MAG: hypothetical protein KGZ53_07205 [Peptococcaceae bacterium]|nr:hypothetical protein [Peptococcaceae bacterium]